MTARGPGHPARTWPVVVGVDGREGGRDAVALSTVLAFPGQPTLVHAYRPMPGGGERAHAAAMAILEAEHAALGRPARLEAIADASPARALQREATRCGADLIVVGSGHRGPLGRALLGDVSRGTLQHAPCAVAVAARGLHRAPPALRVIGVGYDGTDEAREALELADRIAHGVRARVELVAVAVPPPGPGDPAHAPFVDPRGWLREEEARAHQLVAEGLAGLRSPADGRAETGLAAERLEELSRRVDLLVVGSRRWGPVRRVLAGSTADRLLHRAACSVLVAPRLRRRERRPR